MACRELSILFETIYKYIFFRGMESANDIMLFISSLLSPGEAGLTFVRPAFLFLGHKFLFASSGDEQLL